MDRLPQELVSYIFAVVVTGPTATDVASLLAITHVCSRWRQIALADGNLWTQIVLTFPVLPRHLSYNVAALMRSGNYSLNIFLDFRNPAWDWNEETHPFRWQDMEPIIRLFVAHIHRWKRFELLTDTWSPIFTFLWYTRRAQSVPLLETLSLSRCNLYLTARGQTFQPLALRQPIQLFGGIVLEKLQNVSLLGVHIDWNNTPFRDLLQLELKYMASDVMPTLDQFRTMLNACPGLLRLAVHGWGPTIGSPASLERRKILLSNLKTFSFGFLDTSHSIDVLSLFDFPSLEELILDNISTVVAPMNIQDSTSLIQWLTSHPIFPFRQIHTLELHSIHCAARCLMRFFVELTSLVKLSVFNLSDDILNGLNVLSAEAQDSERNTGSGYLCPSLRELHCQGADPDILLGVVSSRASLDNIQSLEKVSLEFIRSPSPLLGSPTYMRLVTAGIEVRFKILEIRRGSQSSGSEQFPVSPSI